MILIFLAINHKLEYLNYCMLANICALKARSTTIVFLVSLRKRYENTSAACGRGPILVTRESSESSRSKVPNELQSNNLSASCSPFKILCSCREFDLKISFQACDHKWFSSRIISLIIFTCGSCGKFLLHTHR